MAFQLQKDQLVFIPLGGSEQFGANLNVYGYKGKYLAIDLGIGFADEYYPGIDILLPNPKFLEDNRKDLSGLIITHAHEDHIGAVAYLWPRLKCPIYCTEFTAEVLKKKLAENPECKAAQIHVIEPYEMAEIGPFKVRFIPVSHSIPEACSIVLETEHGQVVHSGDWNLDEAPVLGTKTKAEDFKKIGQEGVLAYVGDSTNAGVAGYSGSEGDVEKGLSAVFKEFEKRIVVTIFSSNIGRIQSICRAAKANNRHVAVLGRSLHRMIGCAKACGYLADIDDFVPEEDISAIPRENLVVIATGSQGEPRAQMALLARGSHRSLKLERGDSVIFSARPIPGNEKNIILVQNRLAAGGIDVMSPRETDHVIHVSGHPARDEIKQMYDWLRPKIVVPVHGEKVMIEDQAELARACQIDKAIAPNNGSVIQLAPIEQAGIIDHVDTGLLAVEPGRIIESGHVAISDRRKLQYSGVVHVSFVMSKKGVLMGRPHVSTTGLIDPKDAQGDEFEADLEDEVQDILEGLRHHSRKPMDRWEEEVRIGIRRAVNDILRFKPNVNVHMMEV
ncbi:MAG: ribonuclease J [Alphaproteobacteria bacterium]|nr:ribonuclease J [Alphaproteobacteria bacterium]